MDISLIILTAIITTIGLIIITEFTGRRSASYVKRFLAFLAIAPFLSILIKILFLMVIDLDNAAKASSEAAEEMMAMLPEAIISGYIGDIVGVIVWGIYRWFKHRI